MRVLVLTSSEHRTVSADVPFNFVSQLDIHESLKVEIERAKVVIYTNGFQFKVFKHPTLMDYEVHKIEELPKFIKWF